ncbi:MAG: hypothetical protein A1D16_12815 [Flavihumibacter sp. CACIAM 22H1]|nr:MAG: hypothetical protein A1D16_12815 [Flavihumibacter sp. CACIAM 22H1]
MVFDYIGKNLDKICIRSVENSNNILTKIAESDKSVIINSCKAAVEDYNYNRKSIIDTLAR